MNIHERKGKHKQTNYPISTPTLISALILLVCLFFMFQATIFSVIFLSCSEGSSWVEPVLSSR